MTLQSEIIAKCYDEIKIKTRNDAAILGYCVKLAMAATLNKDGSISFPFMYFHKNNEQWQAEKIVDFVVRELYEKTTKLYQKGIK